MGSTGSSQTGSTGSSQPAVAQDQQDPVSQQDQQDQQDPVSSALGVIIACDAAKLPLTWHTSGLPCKSLPNKNCILLGAGAAELPFWQLISCRANFSNAAVRAGRGLTIIYCQLHTSIIISSTQLTWWLFSHAQLYLNYAQIKQCADWAWPNQAPNVSHVSTGIALTRCDYHSFTTLLPGALICIKTCVGPT